MADVNNATSGLAGKRKNHKKGRQPKKSNTKLSLSNDNDSQVTCLKCEEVFTDDNDKLLECERCDSWFCAECLDISGVEYEIIGKRKDFHWFCFDCEKSAITAVKSDKEIEEKCAAYMESITGKIVEIEDKLNNKAEKSVVEDLKVRITGLESKGARGESGEAQNDTVNCDTIRETIEEQREREFRKRNIIIQNLTESKKTEPEERKAEDLESVKVILSEIGVSAEDTIEKCVRIGKQDPKRCRITKVMVKNVELRRAILKGSRHLKDNADYKDVFIGPDLTKMQRAQDYNMRKELRERRSNGETDIFISRGKIIQGKQRALHFRGGASTNKD